MEKQYLSIDGIPAILWGDKSESLFIAVHGDQSNKADDIITIFAEEAIAKGHQVLSFDLPEHGERKDEARLCNARNCVDDIGKVLDYAHACSNTISLFGCSMGAYFSMLACKNEQIGQALFLSPIVDMKRIINNMMIWFDVSEERLEKEQEIATPVKTLYWDYYQYVLNNPIEWNKPTALLYGEKDNLCELEYITRFSRQADAGLTIMEDGEHFFHTKEQLAFFKEWVGNNIILNQR